MRRLAILLALSLMALIWSWSIFERKMLYHFSPLRITPTDTGLTQMRESTLATPDGETLVIWSVAARATRPTILYFHGNAGNLAQRASRFQQLLDRGYGLVAPAYRGAGGSSGTPHETPLRADAVQVFDQLADILGTPPLGPVIVYGESLGAAVATALAATRPAQGLVLEAPFASMPAMAALHYPNLPLGPFITQTWDTLAHAPAITNPVLILHGLDDRLIPATQGQSVYEALAAPDKELALIKGAGHNNVWTSQAKATLYRFLDRL